MGIQVHGKAASVSIPGPARTRNQRKEGKLLHLPLADGGPLGVRTCSEGGGTTAHLEDRASSHTPPRTRGSPRQSLKPPRCPTVQVSAREPKEHARRGADLALRYCAGPAAPIGSAVMNVFLTASVKPAAPAS